MLPPPSFITPLIRPIPTARIPARAQTTIEWHEVVARFLEKQRSGEYRVSISQQELTAHDVASRILRRENFLVALIDQKVLDLRPIIPILGPSRPPVSMYIVVC